MKLLTLAVFCGLAALALGSDFSLLDIFRGNLHRILDQAERDISYRKDLSSLFDERISTLRVELDSSKQMTNAEASTVLRDVRLKINRLAKDLNEAKKHKPVNSYAAYRSVREELHEIFVQIKEIVSTDEGLHAIKRYAASLEVPHPVVFLVKAFIESSDDDTLKDMLQDMFSGVNYYGGYASVSDLGNLFKRAKELVDTDEGLTILKEYINNLKPSNPIVERIRGFIIVARDEAIREVMDALFSGLAYVAAPTYDAKSELHDVFSRIKVIVSTQEGLDAIKDYASNIEATDPIILLVKAFIEGADDDTLRVMLQDMFGGITYYAVYANVEELRPLFKRAKQIIDTAEGLEAFKQYVEKLQPQHPIVQRIKQVVSTASDDRIRTVINALFSGLGGYYSAAVNPREELHDIFSQIKQIVSTQEGLDAIKEYARGLEPVDQHVYLVKAFIEGASDETLKEMLQDMFAGINYYSYAGVSELRTLFKRAKAIVDTNEGLAILKGYVKNLQPQNPIVQRIQQLVNTASDDRIRAVLDGLFSGLQYFAAPSSYKTYEEADKELGEIFVQIKAIVHTEEGLHTIKEYARNLVATDPIVLLVKAFIEGSDDDTLQAMLQDMFSGIHYYIAYANVGDLGDLFLRAKAIIDTDAGLAVFKQYVKDLRPQHPIVQRIKEVVSTASDERIRAVLDALFSGLHSLYSAQYHVSEEIEDIVESLREKLITQDGLQAIKAYAKRLTGNHPVTILVKNFLQSADNDEIQELVLELMKGVDVSKGHSYPSSLSELAKQFKVYMSTERGLLGARLYFYYLQSEHLVVQRIQQFVSVTSDIPLREVLDELLEPIHV